MMEIVPSILILGPTGSGKSSFIRQALKVKGSGAVAMMPGMDEFNSYVELAGQPGFVFEGFDDVGFFPSLKEYAVEGMNKLLRWQKGIYDKTVAEIKEGRALPHAVFAMDTVSAAGQLAYNAALVKTGRDEPPPAQSPDGAHFYTLLRQYQEQMFRIPRALKGLGVSFIAVSHVTERETTETTNANAEQKTKSIVASVPGGFRDVLPGFFDLVLHAGVRLIPAKTAGEAPRNVHWLKWKPSSKRPTKSRLGNLSAGTEIENDYEKLMQSIGAAVDARS